MRPRRGSGDGLASSQEQVASISVSAKIVVEEKVGQKRCIYDRQVCELITKIAAYRSFGVPRVTLCGAALAFVQSAAGLSQWNNSCATKVERKELSIHYDSLLQHPIGSSRFTSCENCSSILGSARSQASGLCFSRALRRGFGCHMGSAIFF
jgi:hypothetical protein